MIISGKSDQILDNPENAENSCIIPYNPLLSGKSGKMHYEWSITANHTE